MPFIDSLPSFSDVVTDTADGLAPPAPDTIVPSASGYAAMNAPLVVGGAAKNARIGSQLGTAALTALGVYLATRLA